MKTIIFFAVFFVTVLGEDMEEQRVTVDTKYRKECADESGAAADHIALIEKGTLDETEMKAKDKCYITCMLQKNNMVDPSNYLRVNRFTKGMTQLKAEKAKAHLRVCNRNQKYKQECSNIVSVLYCFIKLMETVEKEKLIIVYKAL